MAMQINFDDPVAAEDLSEIIYPQSGEQFPSVLA